MNMMLTFTAGGAGAAKAKGAGGLGMLSVVPVVISSYANHLTAALIGGAN